jgi:hypothetical protein
MFTALHHRRNWPAAVSARVSTMQTCSHVATIPASHSTAWTFGYAKPYQRPPEHSP